MEWRSRASILAVLLVFSPFVPLAAAECIIPDTPCRDFARHTVVFQGRVERITPLGPPGAFAPNLVRLAVEHAWKGLQGASADIFEADTLDGDYHGFTVGERYVVYANRDPRTGQIRAFGCDRTKPVAEARADLRFLESLSRPATGGTIFGVVAVKRDERETTQPVRLPGVRLLLDGVGVHRETRSDPNGEFEFKRLKPGSYRLSVAFPPGYLPDSAQPFVRGADGKPLSLTTVEIESDRDCALAAFTARR
jgi:hypothetical protein